MNLNTLKEFRHEVYQSFGQANNVLFKIAEALGSEDGACLLSSLPLLNQISLLLNTFTKRVGH